MRKRNALACSPAAIKPTHHSRSQLLDNQDIHAVPLQNAKDRGRVGRTGPGVHGEQAQPERWSQQILSRAMVVPEFRDESALTEGSCPHSTRARPGSQGEQPATKPCSRR